MISFRLVIKERVARWAGFEKRNNLSSRDFFNLVSQHDAGLLVTISKREKRKGELIRLKGFEYFGCYRALNKKGKMIAEMVEEYDSFFYEHEAEQKESVLETRALQAVRNRLKLSSTHDIDWLINCREKIFFSDRADILDNYIKTVPSIPLYVKDLKVRVF